MEDLRDGGYGGGGGQTLSIEDRDEGRRWRMAEIMVAVKAR